MNDLRTEKRVAVTGATGMIGSHLVAELVRAGYSDIILPVRDKARVENIRRTFRRLGVAWNDKAVTVAETSLTDPDALAEVFSGVDTVFNCAAVIMTGKLTARQLIDNNTAVARGVAGAAVKAGVRRVIHTSSIVVLAPHEKQGIPITEENPPHDNPEGAPYARSKYLSELEIRRVEGHGIGLTLLYPAVVLGEGDWSVNGSSALVPLMSAGQPLYTDGVMAYADVRDVARAYIAVDRCPEAVGQGFIVAGANLSYRELFTLGAQAAGRPKPAIRIGRRTLMFGYGIVKAVTALGLMKDKNIKKSNLVSLLVGNRYDGSKITRVCGFSYTPPEKTVERVVGAYLSETKGIKS